jgi:hypothetical protein
MSYWDMTAGTVGKLWVFIGAMTALGLWLAYLERKANS